MDLSDPNLKDTPNRVARMFCQEFFSCIDSEFDDYKLSPNNRNYSQIIMLDRVYFISTCAHHFLPFTGHAWVLYIPKAELLGASKCARLINHFASRPQLQESLCCEVAEALQNNVRPSGTMVVMRGIHSCMRCRGVKQYGGGGMTTSSVQGVFATDKFLEQKGYDLIKISLFDKEH